MLPILATRADMVLPECFRHLDGVPLELIDDGNEYRIMEFGIQNVIIHSYMSPEGWDIQDQVTDL